MDGTQANGCFLPLALNLLSENIEVCINQSPTFSIEMENHDANDFNITFEGLPLGVVANVVLSPLSENSIIDVKLTGFQNPGDFVIVMHVQDDAQSSQVSIPVTIKCRIGIDDMEDYESFAGFIDTVKSSGCKKFVVHARNAWLQGLSPKENRDVPPLKYDYVYRLKKENPDLDIIVDTYTFP